MTARETFRMWALLGFVAGDLGFTVYELVQARKRAKAWDDAIKKETATDGISGAS